MRGLVPGHIRASSRARNRGGDSKLNYESGTRIPMAEFGLRVYAQKGQEHVSIELSIPNNEYTSAMREPAS